MLQKNRILFAVLAALASGSAWIGSAWGTGGPCLTEIQLVLPTHTCDECLPDWTGTKYEKCGDNSSIIIPEEECFLPTNVDGMNCWEMSMTCGGIRRQYIDPLCQTIDPNSTWWIPFYCQRSYIVATSVDNGDYPICPTP